MMSSSNILPMGLCPGVFDHLAGRIKGGWIRGVASFCLSWVNIRGSTEYVVSLDFLI